MTAIQLDTAIQRELGLMSGNTSLLEKALEALRSIRIKGITAKNDAAALKKAELMSMAGRWSDEDSDAALKAIYEGRAVDHCYKQLSSLQGYAQCESGELVERMIRQNSC